MKATRKLIPALAMLIVAAVVMSTASYAWFTMSRQVTAKGMNVTVTAPNNLLIKVKGEADTTYEAEKDLESANIKLVPASSIDGLALYSVKDGQALDAISGALFANTQLKTSTLATAAAEGGYMDFEYNIKTQGDAVDVYVKSTVLTMVTEAGTYTITDAGAIAEPAFPAEVTREEGITDGVKYEALTGGQVGYTKTFHAKEAASTPVVTTVDLSGLKGFRFAVVDMSVLATPACLGVVNVGGGANHTVGQAVDSLDVGDIAVKGTVTALDIGGAVGARDTAISLDAGQAKDTTIRVWIEGEDTTCTVLEAANITASLEVVLADINYEG